MTPPAGPGHLLAVQPADVVVLRGTTAWTAKLIEVAAVLRGLPPASHVAVMHHWDAHGRPWGVEGRPGGVGWVDMTRYLADRRTVTNAAQPKAAVQRKAVTTLLATMLGTPYDWVGGICGDAVRDLDMPKLWGLTDPGTGLIPGAVVCSSLAAYGYDHEGLAAPCRPGEAGAGRWRDVEPADWAQWIDASGWAAR